MPLPVVFATVYLAINLAIMAWLVREESHGSVVPTSAVILARTLRYGPPLLGMFYLVTIAGDWPYLLFVGGFFAGALWLLDSLLNYPPPPTR